MKKIASIILIISTLLVLPSFVSADQSFYTNNTLLEIIPDDEYGTMTVDDEAIYTGTVGIDLLIFKIRYIYTPNTNERIQVFKILNEHTSARAFDYNSTFDNNYPNATRLSTATLKYNCHSYAWYSQDVETNDYWMNNPSNFYLDYSYCTVSTPQVGDIICYYDDKGTADTSDDNNLHSGIVTAVLSGTSNGVCGNSDLVTVTSKWGPAGLYSHNGYECPYTLYSGIETETHRIAEYVKYYRSTHNYTYANTNSSKHTVKCQECAYSFSADHELNLVSISSSQHQERCVCGRSGAASNHAESYYRHKSKMLHGIYCSCGFMLGTATHSFVADDNRYSHCTDCGVVVDTWSDIIIMTTDDTHITQ